MPGARGCEPTAGAQEPTAAAELVDARPVTGSQASGVGAVPHMALRACTAGLAILGPDGAEVRRWSWSDVEGWDADGAAPDGDGGIRQVLAIRARPAPFSVLADAHSLGSFLPALAAAHADGRGRVAAAARRRRRMPYRLAGAALALAGGLAAGAPALFGHAHAPAQGGRRVPGAHGALASTVGTGSLHLAETTAAPAPAPASVAASPLAAHEVLGFLPYWTLPDPGSVDLSGLTTLAYFSVDVNADGTVDESPSNPGWVGYQSRALASLVDEAHHEEQRVVLTATCFDQATLDALTGDPAAQSTLASTLVSLVRSKNLDGVNLDFEGTGSADRGGLRELVATVSRALQRADAAWQFSVDTYASSASDPEGFYDVAGMAPFVDAFVVMDYDMGDTFAAGPTAPATGAGFTDTEVVASYDAAAGASKVILGMPLYGEDWPTTGPTAGDPATGPPAAVADDQIAPTDTLYWDPVTEGPWAVYRTGSQWHQVWFDDPASLAAKAQLAQDAGLRGVALWALGMADGTGDQESVVSGVAAEPQPPEGPVTVWRGARPGWFVPGATGTVPGASGEAGAGSAPSAGALGAGGLAAGADGSSAGASTAGAGSQSASPAASGVFEGADVTLVPWPGAAPTTTTPAGSLTTFSATGTAVACLASGPALPVVRIDGTSAYIVRASAGGDCATGTWAFVLPQGTTSSTGAGEAPTGSGAGGGTGVTGERTTPVAGGTTTAVSGG